MKEYYVRLIFGLKLKQIRINKGLALQRLSEISGLSKSYLNEIEKGKKYPKTDKILILASALETNYEELVSLKLDKNLAPVAEILQSDLLNEIPLEIFGIDERALIEIVANAPAKISAFISTIIEIANNYNLTREGFFIAVLRSFQEANNNYFPEIEVSAKEFLNIYNIDEVSEKIMEEVLEKEYKYVIEYKEFVDFNVQEFVNLRSIFIPKKNKLFINNSIDNDQKKFILAKEIGYNFLKLNERLNVFSWSKCDNFDELLNNFYASYFAGAVIIPEGKFVKDLDNIFSMEDHNLNEVDKVFKKYTKSPETAYHRLTNVLPKHFGIKDLFFLRLTHKIETESYRLTKELHLHQQQSPHANEINEHYCRRWVSIRVLQNMEKNLKEDYKMDAQISRYPYHQNKNYYVITSGAKDSSNPEYLRSITLGIITSQARRKIKFLKDENIPSKEVAVTCENCGIENCKERIASPIRFEKMEKNKRLNEAIEKFIELEEK